MMDTSALVAALIEDHEYHALSRPHLAPDIRLPAIVLAETFAQLRRTFGQSAMTATAVVSPLTTGSGQVLPTTASAISTVVGRAVELDLGGNIHDALIAQICAEHDLPLVTLDGRQHRLALALGARSTYLLA
jgi:predicted nucleic acid-binding protein